MDGKEELDLRGKEVTDWVLLKVLVHIPSLMELNLKGTKVTRAGVAKFNEILPNCHVIL